MATDALSAYVRKATSRSLVLAYSCGRCIDFFTAHMYHQNHHQRFQRPPRPGRRPAGPLPWLSWDRHVDSVLEAQQSKDFSDCRAVRVRQEGASRPFVLAHCCVGAKQTKLTVGIRHEPSKAFWPPHAERFEATSDAYNGCVFTRECSKCARAKQEQRRARLGVVHEARAKALDLLVGCDRAERNLTKALHSYRAAVSRCGCHVATSSLWLCEGVPGTRLRMRAGYAATHINFVASPLDWLVPARMQRPCSRILSWFLHRVLKHNPLLLVISAATEADDAARPRV